MGETVCSRTALSCPTTLARASVRPSFRGTLAAKKKSPVLLLVLVVLVLALRESRKSLSLASERAREPAAAAAADSLAKTASSIGKARARVERSM